MRSVQKNKKPQISKISFTSRLLYDIFHLVFCWYVSFSETQIHFMLIKEHS